MSTVKLNAKQLRERKSTDYSLPAKGEARPFGRQSTAKQDIYIILDNVLDTYNIGAIFRLADAVGAKRVYLCGGTETPPNHRIKKASINTTEVVEWEYAPDSVGVIKNLKFKIKNLSVVAIEQHKKAMPYNKYEYNLPLALVVGNESYGILPETLKECDGVVELPMFGVNISLNVMVSLAIVLYKALEKSDT